MAFSPCGVEHLSLCIHSFSFWSLKFQCSLTVLGERDEFQDLHVVLLYHLKVGVGELQGLPGCPRALFVFA